MLGRVLRFILGARQKTGVIEMLPRFVQESSEVPRALSDKEKQHRQVSQLMIELKARSFITSVSRSYLKSRNLYHDRLERIIPRIRECSLFFKEKRPRSCFTQCIQEVPGAALGMVRRGHCRQFQNKVLPGLIKEASIRYKTRQQKQMCLSEIGRVGGTKSAQRARLAYCLANELPSAIRDRASRGLILSRKRTVLSDLLVLLYHKQQFQNRLKNAEIFEKCLAELIAQTAARSTRVEKSHRPVIESDHFLTALFLVNFLLLGVVGYGVASGVRFSLRMFSSSVVGPLQKWRVESVGERLRLQKKRERILVKTKRFLPKNKQFHKFPIKPCNVKTLKRERIRMG